MRDLWELSRCGCLWLCERGGLLFCQGDNTDACKSEGLTAVSAMLPSEDGLANPD